ncbi:hypothetical protein MTAT_20370 [Moorella thermoacetica]|uniref:Uncharacterized protein n=1 Tax=Neomoorella thermoacetica TaxID=1525 RepID=A0AAC9MVR0_NEOTH|nr:hypothetical protein [Moorella thermoacetica]AOQ24692.1 hypothetical protein Maut_02264 [Moorella thermoacetica]TYL12795.1 hypothetical protein MTAT_20370 [Moorella thermoacetica]
MTPEERAKLDYNPELHYDLPYQDYADEYVVDTTTTLVEQARSFSPVQITALLDELTQQYEDLKNQLGAVAPEAISLLQTTLDLSRDFLAKQQALLGDEAAIFDAWQRSLLNYNARRADFDRMRQAVPWDAVQYPELYPDMSSQVEEFWLVKNQFNQAEKEMRQLSRRVFVVLDGLNLVRSFYVALQNSLSQMNPPESSSSVISLPAEARQLLAARLEELQQASSTSSLFLVAPERQQALLEQIISIQEQQLTAGQVRDWLDENNPGRAVREALEQAVNKINEQYKQFFLDGHKMYSLIVNRCQEAIAAGVQAHQLAIILGRG